ncbi:MAG: hypothetical protein WBM86_00600 [Waterburya sp.]
MSQTKSEKKFLQVKVGKTHYNIASIVCEKPVSIGFQEFQTNIAGGEE